MSMEILPKVLSSMKQVPSRYSEVCVCQYGKGGLS